MLEKGKGIGWKKIGFEAIVGFCFTMLALSLFTFIIEPFINEKPNLEMIAKEPIFFNEGELVTFNITIENTGRATAREILILTYEKSENEKPQYDAATGYPNILQSGDVTFAEFEMIAPESQQPYWIIEIHVTTTDGYHWEFNLVYDYEPETKIYQIHKPY